LARWFGGRGSLERRLADEMTFHVEQQAEQHERDGLEPREARRLALVSFGGVEAWREQTRDEFRLVTLEDLARDLRQAWRSLWRARAFTAISVLTLALGIGAATAVFAVVHGVLLKPLAYPDADRLVSVAHRAPGIAQGDVQLMSAQYFTYRDFNRSFERFGLWVGGTATVTEPNGPREIGKVTVTYGVLDALAVPPARGRWFTRRDDEPGSHGTVILMDGYWRERFGADPSIIGRTIVINGRARDVIGIMPPAFRLGAERDVAVLLPFQFDRQKVVLGQFNFNGIARLRPGVTVAAANADLGRLIPVVMDSWPFPPGVTRTMFDGLKLTPALHLLAQDVVGDVGPVLWIVMATVGGVLLIAFANVANLVMARAQQRRGELTVRAALGAGRMRLARGLFAEHLLLTTMGAMAAVPVAELARRLLVALAPATLPRVEDIALDPVVLLFAAACAVGCSVAFALLPLAGRAEAWQRPAAAGAATRTATDGPAAGRVRRGLVTAQVALALVLLVGAGLMVRTFAAMRAVDPGFDDPAHVQLVRLSISSAVVAAAERVVQIEAAMRDGLAALPGVTAVSFADVAPLEDAGFDVIVAQKPTRPDAGLPPARQIKYVAPGFFGTVGTRLLAGRDFSWTETLEHRRVGVVSEDLARELWGGATQAIGQQIGLVGQPWREVVGVVAAVHDNGLNVPPPPTVYWPALFEGPRGLTAPRGVVFVMRGPRAGTEALSGEIRRVIQAINPNVPIVRLQTLGDVYSRSMARTSFTVVMLAVAAGTALLLGLIGIYATIAYVVAQRTREIGVRMALGADHQQIRRAFLRRGLISASWGIAAGLVAAVVLSRFMATLVFGVSPTDITTYVAGAVAVLVATSLASYLPARRATLVDPIQALRTDTT
jgi:predicted permease